jgi:hypothetical protein
MWPSDDNWLVVAPPGAHRLPWMTSLDLSATRIVSVSHHLPDVRLGLKLYNVVRSNTERAVQRDIEQARLRHAIRPRSARLLRRLRVPVGQEPPS